MTEEERAICKRLHRDSRVLFVAKDGKSLYALVNGDFCRFTTEDDFHKMTGRAIVQYLAESLEAKSATILEHSHERST